MSEGPAKRPRLRFGLRTMFVVVTVVAVWLGWNVRIVHQRKAVLTDIEKRGGRIDRGPSSYKTVSIVRSWLGDASINQITPPRDGSLDDDEQIRAPFPEAYVYLRLPPLPVEIQP